MEMKLLVPLLITSVVTIVGWFTAHELAAWRDRVSKRRDQRIEYLIQAFRHLAKAVRHEPLHEVADEIRSAVADIQLFGSKDQILNVQNFVRHLVEDGEGPLDDLLDSLRSDLRKELKLSDIEGLIMWVQIKPKWKSDEL